MKNSRRVVITGIGVISPNGVGKENFWKNTINGVSGVRLITEFDVSPFNTKIAAVADDYNPEKLGLSKEEINRMDRYVQFAVIGADMAMKDANVDVSKINLERSGISLANAICGTKYMEEEFLRVTNNGKDPIDPRKVRPDLYDASMFNTPSSEIATKHGLKGICNTISTGCTAGTDSVGYAYESIKNDEVDFMITGASEAPLTPITFGAFDVINVLSVRNDDPRKASRPFDNKRDGFVLSEGCGILIVEELNHALKRGAKIYAEIIGYGTTCNAYHMTDLPPDGTPMSDSIILSLKDADISAQDIDYINAHGSSTRQNDVFETNAYKMSLGESIYNIPISSLKSMIGHPLAGANGVELTLCALIFERNILPPTINQDEKDPICDLDYIPNKARDKKIDVMLKTSSGFSGIHSSMVLRRFK